MAAVGAVALLPPRPEDPVPSSANRRSILWDVPPPKKSAKSDGDDKPVEFDRFDMAVKAAGVASTLKLSKLALELGLIDKLPEPFDHRNPADAIKAAQAMHKAFPKDILGDDFSYEISTNDGRLIVRLSTDFLRLDEELRESRMERLGRIWKMTKFTRDYGFSPTIEFRSKDGITTIEQ